MCTSKAENVQGSGYSEALLCQARVVGFKHPLQVNCPVGLALISPCTTTILLPTHFKLCSWGTGNGDKGFFKVKFGVCGMLAPGDTLGVGFIPAQPVTLNVTGPVVTTLPANNNKTKSCYNYTVCMLAMCVSAPSHECMCFQ